MTDIHYEEDETPVAVVVADDPDRSEFVATIDGREVGVLAYERGDGVIDLQHTVVDPAAGGRGVGSALVRDALDRARTEGIRIIPTCPFVKKFLEGHPGEQDLVAG